MDNDVTTADRTGRLEALFDNRSGAASETVISYGGQSWSGSDLLALTDLHRDALVAAGAAEGEIVAVVARNSPELVACMLATWSLGAAMAPINPMLTAGERGKVLGRLQPSVVAYQEVKDRFDEGGHGLVRIGGAPVAERASTGPGRAVGLDAALILHSSGTTGTPKAVVQSHAALLEAVESVVRKLGGRAPRRPGEARRSANLVAFPLAHLAGVFNLLLALRNDREILLLDRFDPLVFAQLVKEYRLPSVILNPTMIHMVLEADIAADQLSSLRFVRSGSAPLPASLAVRFFERFGVPILNAYGQTETAGEVIGWMAEDVRLFGDAKLGSVGRPHPGVDVRFLDEAGNDSGEGELCIRSKTLLNRFLNGDSPELVDGFLRTGDLGRMDADGFIWLTGRRSDVVNRGGFKVLPEEVEEVIRSHPSVADVMVAGLPDDRLGEVPVAFVVVRGQVADDLAESIQAHVGDQAARYKIPTAVHFVSQLPRNDMGKLLRRRAPELLNTTKEKA